MAILRVRRFPYREASLERWKGKKSRMLSRSRASKFLKEILGKKAANRGTSRRFFGEAFVAANTRHKDGYYGSFKWLTSSLPSGGKRTKPASATLKSEFQRALLEHFGEGQLTRLRHRAIAFERRTGVRPVPPDLWFVDRRRNHRFIEVKLPGDSIRAPQIAGLAVIASCLRPKRKVSVEIVELHPGYEQMFKKYCRVLRRAG